MLAPTGMGSRIAATNATKLQMKMNRIEQQTKESDDSTHGFVHGTPPSITSK